MSDKFQDKYRIPSARAEWWDYRDDAAYFVTICTAGREHYFGEIVETASEPEIRLSELGQIARQNWVEIPKHFSFIKLNGFVVMPNHVHGILAIDRNCGIPGRDAMNRVSDANDTNSQSDAINRVSTDKPIGGITGRRNPMLTENLSRVIRWYKGHTTFQCHSIYADFAWQTRFHDHIIRDENEFWKIREYILNNPKRWKDDKYNATTESR